MSELVRYLKFSLSSYWRVSSGKGAAAVADSLVLRDGDGLPVLPGKAVKGLLRDAMEMATLSGAVTKNRVERWFGSSLPGHSSGEGGDDQERLLEQGRFSSREGELWFGSATLPTAWTNWARASGSGNETQDILGALFSLQASTAIDDDGTAKEGSLRVAEVAVPMELTAQVRGPGGDLSWLDDLRVSLPLLRALGSRRNRGFGRVDVSLEERE